MDGWMGDGDNACWLGFYNADGGFGHTERTLFLLFRELRPCDRDRHSPR